MYINGVDCGLMVAGLHIYVALFYTDIMIWMKIVVWESFLLSENIYAIFYELLLNFLNMTGKKTNLFQEK